MYQLLNPIYTLDWLSLFVFVDIIQQANPAGFVVESYFRAMYSDQEELILVTIYNWLVKIYDV